MKDAPLVRIVDDEGVRSAVEALLEPTGYRVELYVSAGALLASQKSGEADCMIVDIQMPRMTGLELHQELVKQDVHAPTIFITALPTDKMRDRAMKVGAVACLAKPFSGVILLEHIKAVVGHDRDQGNSSGGSC